MAKRSHCLLKACASVVLLSCFLVSHPVPVSAQDDKPEAPSIVDSPKRLDLKGLRELLNTGKYDECITAAGAQAGKVYGEGYYIVKAQAELSLIHI